MSDGQDRAGLTHSRPTTRKVRRGSQLVKEKPAQREVGRDPGGKSACRWRPLRLPLRGAAKLSHPGKVSPRQNPQMPRACFFDSTRILSKMWVVGSASEKCFTGENSTQVSLFRGGCSHDR